MSTNLPDELEAQFEELKDAETTKLAEKAELFVRMKRLSEAVTAEKNKLYHDLMIAMEEQGFDRIGVGDFNVSRTIHHPLGIAEGESPDDYLRNKEAVREYTNRWNPPEPATTVAAIKRARDAELAENPDAPLPPFLVENDDVRLSVRKAK